MQVEAWVKSRLLASDAVKALVGDRVYPVTVPQEKDVPAIVYFRQRTVRTYTARGSDGQPRVSIRLHAITKDYQEAKKILEAARPLFNGVRETPAAPPVSAFCVARCVITDEADAFEPPPEGSEDVIYKPFLDLEIDHKE